MINGACVLAGLCESWAAILDLIGKSSTKSSNL